VRGKLELTWVGKDERPRLEPRVLVEDPSKSYGDPNSENMLIFGDNLLALKALEQDFAGRIKCIYIDPPYNTGAAWEHYDDGLEHSLWLSLMRDRLECLARLLAKNGVAFVQIDDNEQAYLRVLMDEVFGRQNFVATVIWQKKYAPKSDSRLLSESHDYILCYARSIAELELHRLPKTERQTGRYRNKDNDPRGPWKAENVLRNEARDYAIFPVIGPNGKGYLPPSGASWRYTKEKMAELIADNRIWFGAAGSSRPAEKRFLSEVTSTMPAETVWLHQDAGHNDEAKRELRRLFPSREDLFQTPKPERLIHRVLTVGSREGDWVLDAFLGTGTTAAVAHKMNRKWIGIEMLDDCDSYCLPRLRGVVGGPDEGGATTLTGWKGGDGLKYYRLAETLLVQDKDLSAKGHPVYIINPKYDDKMLIRAICKVEGFRYRNEGRLHGVSSENRFLHVTTQLLTQAYLDSLVSDIRLEQSLLIYCTRRSRNLVVPDNVEVKKIPRDLLSKCDYAEDVK
jgi:adenine-specific DNA-methyltransferase